MRWCQSAMRSSASSAGDTCVAAPLACMHASIARANWVRKAHPASAVKDLGLADRGRDRDAAPVDPLGTVDRGLGRAIERSMTLHHAWRLRRLGRLEALRPPDDGSPWAREAPPAREGCTLEVLVDGEEVLPAIAEAIRGARRSVRLAGWAVSPHL